MASKQSDSLYPKITDDSTRPFTSSSSSLYPSLHNPTPNPSPNPSPSPNLYPSLDMKELVNNLFPDSEDSDPTLSSLPPPVEETLILIPGAILHLIDPNSSLELASGDFSVVQIRQADNIVAVLARIGDVQWPIAHDAAAVRLDDSHYFFTLHDPSPDQDSSPSSDDKGSNLINYGLTFASKGQGKLLEELDRILASCSEFSRQKVEDKVPLLDGKVEREVTPEEAKGGKKKVMEERAAAYWTTLAPNVEDYGGSVARGIAMGSGKLIQGILWCGDVTVDRLKWGQEFLRKRMDPNAKPSEVSKDALKRMKRVKRVTKMSEKVVTGILSGVVKVSGFFTSSVVNSKVGKKFFGLLPGEVVLASLDGFAKICDAAEMAGKNVLQTSSVVTTGLVSHRYGDQAGEMTHESLGAAGHAIGTAWAVFKIRKALNPKSAMKPTTLAKSAAKAAAAELKAKK